MARHATSPCLYRELAHVEGYCCTYHYTVALAHAPATVMSRHLGVDENTIHYWRNKVRNGTSVRCERCPAEIDEHPQVKAWKAFKVDQDCSRGL